MAHSQAPYCAFVRAERDRGSALISGKEAARARMPSMARKILRLECSSRWRMRMRIRGRLKRSRWGRWLGGVGLASLRCRICKVWDGWFWDWSVELYHVHYRKCSCQCRIFHLSRSSRYRCFNCMQHLIQISKRGRRTKGRAFHSCSSGYSRVMIMAPKVAYRSTLAEPVNIMYSIRLKHHRMWLSVKRLCSIRPSSLFVLHVNRCSAYCSIGDWDVSVDLLSANV